MANSQDDNSRRAYATVDEAPEAAGYGTSEINILEKMVVSGKKTRQVVFSIRGTGSMTVTLQYKCTNDSDWTDLEEFATNERKSISDDSVDVTYRAIVKQSDYSSGEKIFGFDW